VKFSEVRFGISHISTPIAPRISFEGL